MQKKLHVKKGDNVVVIAGDSKGQQGKVLVVNVDKGRAIVEGVTPVGLPINFHAGKTISATSFANLMGIPDASCA